MLRLSKLVACSLISASLIVTSTAAAASTGPLPAAHATDGWIALSMLTPSSAAVLGTTSLAAAQPETAPPPPPPPPAYTGGPGTPPIPVILVWLATLGVIIYIATKSNHSVHSNSPA